jgi:hypothetical protein
MIHEIIDKYINDYIYKNSALSKEQLKIVLDNVINMKIDLINNSISSLLMSKIKTILNIIGEVDIDLIDAEVKDKIFIFLKQLEKKNIKIDLKWLKKKYKQ